MKIGRLVRALKLDTVVPSNIDDAAASKTLAVYHKLKDSKSNYMCASACFLVFVAGIHRESSGFSEPRLGIHFSEPRLGIHRPYLSENDLRALSSGKAMAAATRTRTVVENYLREMGVPAKYADQMFSVPKDGIRWLSNNEFEANFAGFIPELKDWVDARCDNRTDLEKTVSKSIKNKFSNQFTAAEKIVFDALIKKENEIHKCEIDIRSDLALRGFADVRYGPFTCRPAPPETWTPVR